MDKKDIYKKAISKYGIDKQIIMVFEEFAELQKELCKHLRGSDNRINICEEIADCEIMLEQMRLYFGNHPQGLVDIIKGQKLARLRDRLEEVK